MPALETIIITPSQALTDEAAPPALVRQAVVVEMKKKRGIGKKVGWKAKGSKGEDHSQEQGSLDYRENASNKQGHNPHSLVDADPLPQKVSFKPLIRGLKKKVHLLRKRLKRVEADLESSQKNASRTTKEITYLYDLHMKDAVSFSIWKGSFEKEIAELKRNASDKF
ncbi:hypothetical protein COCNU_scaffold001878G000020 [Cocos nucifera]|nr:hypothetical protein [Cocos nucifera]